MDSHPRFEMASPPARFEEVQSPTLPLPPPRGREELEGFLADLSCVPVDQIEGIRAMFAAFDAREELARLLHEALAQRPCGDVGRFLLLLSAVGELANRSSLEPLWEIVWAADAELMTSTAGPLDGAGKRPGHGCMFPSSGMIQGRAVEMFAWIAATAEDDRLLAVIERHPSVVTRLAAADAFLFAHHDSPSALERALSVARPEDRSGIGVARLVRGGDREAFERAVEHAHRDHAPRLPERIHIRGRQQDDSTKGAR